MKKIQIEKEHVYGAVRKILGVVCIVCMAAMSAMGQDEVSTLAQFPGGDKALFEYLGGELQYPKAAFEQGIEGRVICQFHVETDGSITEPHVVRTSGDSTLDQEAIRALNTMPKWIPATQMGEPIRSIYTIPITFKKPKEAPTAQPKDSMTVYAVVEHMPQFPGGQEAMFRYIDTHLWNPPSINMQDIEGTTICSMVIAADGSVTNVAAARSCGNTELDSIAIRVVCGMPKWEPERSRGKAVLVRYAIPVTFKGKYEYMRQTSKDDGNDYLIQPKAKKDKKKAVPKGRN